MRALPPLAVLAIGAIVLVACGEPIQLPTPEETSVTGGLGGDQPSSSSGGSGGAGGLGGHGGTSGEGGSPPAVWVGMVANPLSEVDPAPRADVVAAAASTFAIGATVFASKRTWKTATRDGFAEDAKLVAAGCPTTPICRPAALTIAVVDGLLDGRPDPLVGERWSSSASMDAIDASIDAAMDELGPALKFLAVGARVDQWLEEHEDDAADLEELLAHAVDRAVEHPNAREDLLVGVGLSRSGALASSGPAAELRALGNATMASLFPGLSDVEGGALVPSPGSIALDLDAIDDVEPGRPVALVEVGYPSAEIVGADADAQGLFIDALFGALVSRRSSFPLVVVSRLHDLGPEACAAEGASLGEEQDEVLAYRCSTGARDDRGDPKPAWASFVVGAAQLASGATPAYP